MLSNGHLPVLDLVVGVGHSRRVLYVLPNAHGPRSVGHDVVPFRGGHASVRDFLLNVAPSWVLFSIHFAVLFLLAGLHSDPVASCFSVAKE